MKNKYTLIVASFLIGISTYAQIGIGTTSPESSAALDVTATDKGFLMPRMTTVQKDAIVAPVEGLQVYDTDTKSVWTYDGSVWNEGVGGAGKFVDGAASNIAYYDGRVGIGINNFSSGHKLFVDGVKDTDGTNTAARINATYEGTGSSFATYALGAIVKNNSTATINWGIGTQGIVENPNAGGTITNAIGTYPQLFNSGTVDWGAGVAAYIENNAGGTMNTVNGESIGVYNFSGATIGSVSLSSLYMENTGTITGDGYGLWVGGASTGSVGGDAYALYIDTPFTNVAGNNYALYSANTADSYFNGNVGFGIDAPLQKVHINGVMRLEPLAAAPAGDLGDLYVGTDNKLYFHNGTAWKEVQLAP